MKNTLSTKSQNPLFSLINSCTEFHSAAIKCADAKPEEFPLQISGLKGSLPSFFIRQTEERYRQNCIHKTQYENKFFQFQKDIVIIVPTQKEADECETDLNTVFEDSVEIFKFPWWGTIPYRAAAKGSAVFGERAGILAKLAVKNPFSEKTRIFIITQRAFLTPVPPASYTKTLVTVLKKGQEFDPEKLAEKLTEQGYLRVPKIGMKGEFVLRGEVLEIFMSGEKYAHRIVFDFDTISQIKLFDSETQTSKENIEHLVIYPQKEIIWTEEFIEKLESEWKKEDEAGIKNDFALYDKAKKQSTNEHSAEVNKNKTDKSQANEQSDINKNEAGIKNNTNNRLLDKKNIHLALTGAAKQEKDRTLAELIEFKETEGEELYYPVLFDKLYSILDYLTNNTDVYFFDWDRLVNAEKMLENEYTVAYRLARQNLPVFPPATMQLDFFNLAIECKKLVAFRTLDTLSNSEENIQDKSISFNTSLEIKSQAGQSYFGNINYLKEQLSSFLKEKYNIFVFADNGNQTLRIKEIIKEFCDSGVQVLPQALTAGFMFSDEKLLVIQENEIFGRKKNTPKSIRKVNSKPIDTFVDLTPGD